MATQKSILETTNSLHTFWGDNQITMAISLLEAYSTQRNPSSLKPTIEQVATNIALLHELIEATEENLKSLKSLLKDVITDVPLPGYFKWTSPRKSITINDMLKLFQLAKKLKISESKLAYAVKPMSLADTAKLLGMSTDQCQSTYGNMFSTVESAPSLKRLTENSLK